MTQGSGDTENPPARDQAASDPSLDRPTPIVDISREVEASRHNTRETARLRTSQITRLVDLTRAEVKRAEVKKDEPARAAAPAAPAPPVAPAAPAVAPSPPPRRHRGFELPLALGVLIFTGAAVVAYTQTRPPQPTPHAPSTGLAPETAPVLAPTPTLAATDAPPATAPPASDAPPATAPPAADVQARQSLERLRSGLDTCIRTHSRTLPGTSAAVPASLVKLKEGAYTPAVGDWKSYAWSCAHFQMSEPMHFQLQWQLVRSNAEGLAVAWIDHDHDGVADRALGFSITLGAKGGPNLGEIQPLAATTPVVIARR